MVSGTYAHLEDDAHPGQTLCGYPWEVWQESVPSDKEIGLRELPYQVRVLVRDSDRARESRPALIEFCPACHRIAILR